MSQSRWLEKAFMLAILGLTVAACAPPTADDAAGGSNEATPGSAVGESAEATGGQLVVARTGDIDNLDPHLATAFQTYQTLELVYDTLFELTPDLEVTEGLVESYEYDEAGTTLTLTLRDDVVFQDGSGLDSEDVTASLERILDEATGAVGRANLTSITAVEATDSTTVELTLNEPDGTLPVALAGVNTSILSSEAIAAGTVGSDPMGTGPFVFENWDQG